MRSKLKPVRCNCGGEAVIYVTHWWGKCYVCECDECGTASRPCNTEAEAIEAWNTAMEITEKSSTVERTAKVMLDDVIITVNGYRYHYEEYLCNACKKKVIGGDDYCSHCGAKLDWTGMSDE